MNQKELSLKNRLKNNKVPLYISIFIALIMDLFLVSLMCVEGYSFKVIIYPSVIVIIDIAYLLTTFFSNYRFKYVIMHIISYTLLILSCLIYVLFFNFFHADRVMSSRWVLLFWLSIHFMVPFVTIISSNYAAKKTNLKLTIPFIFILLLCSSAFCVSLFQNGVFGQFRIEVSKTLVYEYKEEEDCYEVKHAMHDKGNKVIVPAKFNNKPVKYISCEIFNDQSIDSIHFEKRELPIEFTNYYIVDNQSINKYVKLYADKNDINDIKNRLNVPNYINKGYLYLINNLYPENLASDEIFITFNYDQNTYNLIDGKLLDIYIGKKNGIFNKDNYLVHDFIEHSDYNYDYDLVWNYERNGYIFYNFKHENKLLLNTSINKNIENATLSFEKIYAIKILNDNDEKYE